jgi:hypothetical protein
MIRMVANRMRKIISHSGVRCGVSSRGIRSSSRRMAGNCRRFGAGGVSRSSHHSRGTPASVSSIQGAAKAKLPIVHIGQNLSRSESCW